MFRGFPERRWFWLTLALSSVTLVGFVFAMWELIELRFFRDADYLTLHYLYVTRGIGSSLLLAFWAAWFVLRERRYSEEQLRRSRERYRGLLEVAPGAVAVYGMDLKVLEWNAAAERLYGFSKKEAIESALPTVSVSGYEELQAILRDVEAGKVVADIETQRRGRDGSLIDVQLSLSIFREMPGQSFFLEVTSDIRERVRLRQTLLQIEKLTTMGQMASGTAHHLNTPLASMLLRIRMARQSQNIESDLNQLESSVRFCQQFVRRLLDFSRRPEARKQPEFVAAAIESVLAFLNPQFHAKQAHVELDLKELDSTRVLADRNELEAVLLILLTNSLDAIASGGNIGVCARPTGRKVQISIHDDGCGIAADDMPRIFQPFFTTKPAGVGTGLGLALANNIVHEHGGQILVNSAAGRGTTMSVALPVYSDAGGAR